MNTQNDKNTEEEKDPKLWKVAKERATFKQHALIYFIINLLFWVLWYIGLKEGNLNIEQKSSIPWPVWPMGGWGIGLLFHYLGTYHQTHSWAEKEYKKLSDKKNKSF